MFQQLVALAQELITTFNRLIKDVQIIKSDVLYLKKIKEFPQILNSKEAGNYFF